MAAVSGFGDEFQVNATAEVAYQPVVVARAGGFATFWASPINAAASSSAQIYANADIKGRLFNSDGTPAGSDFTVNTSLAGAQYRPVATRLSDGNLLVAWQDGVVNFGSSASATLRAQEFTSAGVAIGGEFVIAGPGGAILPRLAPLAGGGFAALWQSPATGASTIQRYDANNATVGAPIAIDSGLARADVATLANGNFVAAWIVDGTEATAQIYDAAGNSVGPRLTQSLFGFGDTARVAPLADGGFAVVVHSFGDFGQSEFAIFSADGTLRASNLIATDSITSDVVGTPDGGFAILFSSTTLDGSGDIFAQLVSRDGNPAGDAILVNTRQQSGQQFPDIAALDNGELIAVWTDLAEFGSGLGRVRARAIDFDAANVSPAAVADKIYLRDGQTAISVAALISNDSDRDGDAFQLTAVGNAEGGGVSLDGDTINFTPTAPAGSFRYTLSDTAGNSATADVAVIFADDRITRRGGGPFVVDVLANDALSGNLADYRLALDFGGAEVVTVDGRQQLSVSPIGNVATSSYFNLAVGETMTSVIGYSPARDIPGYAAPNVTLTVTYEGWAQLGGTGADTLTGSDLADHLSGGTGAANRLVGLGGDDWYTVQLADDVIVEAASGGRDSVRTTLADYTLQADLENLYLVGASGAVGTGNAADNIIIGTTGNDTIFGLGGNDRISTVSGTDLVFGGTGDDSFFSLQGSLIFENPDEGIDTVIATGNYYLYANIENLTLFEVPGAIFPLNIFGVGNDLDNVITGNSGDNLIIGLDGYDTAIGGGGNDSLFGGTSYDSLAGDAGSDFLAGGDDDDTLDGGADDDVLYGEAGDDLLNGGDGLDYILGGHGNDRADGGGGVDALYGEAGRDVLLGGAGIDFLAGGNDEDTLDGGTDADVLYGEAGDDGLIGGLGFFTDILVGGSGGDTLHGASGLGDFDLLDGGADSDLYFVDTPFDVTFEADDGGVDSVVADITGTGYYLYANVENLDLVGATPFGVGNELNNRITAGSGSQWLLGGAGDDILDAGDGNDVLFGEAGADVFVFQGGNGGDVIGDFTPGVDVIDVLDYRIADFAALRSRFVENDGTTAINLGDGNFLVLNGVGNAALTARDFILGVPTTTVAGIFTMVTPWWPVELADTSWTW